MISVIRGRFRVFRYDLIVLIFNITSIAKNSNQITSLPSAGSCGYAHQRSPYPITVTKIWYITTNIKNAFKNLIIEIANDKYDKNISVRTIKTS